MPVYNEAPTILRAIQEAARAGDDLHLELIVVDDGSTDDTDMLLERYRCDSLVRVFTHKHNMGKGAAIRTGLAAARAPVTAILDADLELSAVSVVKMFEVLESSPADVVIGARPLSKATGQPGLFRLGNLGLTRFASWLFQTELCDLMAGQKMMSTSLFRLLEIEENGFAVEAEIVARAIQRCASIVHVSVPYRARSANEGKKLSAVDGFQVVRTLLRCRFNQPVVTSAILPA